MASFNERTARDIEMQSWIEALNEHLHNLRYWLRTQPVRRRISNRRLHPVSSY